MTYPDWHTIYTALPPPRRKIVKVQTVYLYRSTNEVAFWIAKLRCGHDFVVMPEVAPEPRVGQRPQCRAVGCLTEQADHAVKVLKALG